MGCTATTLFRNLVYPLLILPYVFRAFRIKKIYDEATNTNSAYNNMNIFRSADGRTQSFLQSSHLDAMLKSGTNLSVQSTSGPPSNPQLSNKNRSDSAISVQSTFDIEDSISFSKELDKRLLCRFSLCWIPFLLLSMTNFVHKKNQMLPTFIQSCDKLLESTALFIWVSIHLVEIGALILTVYWIRLVWRAFSVKQELMVVAVLDLVYCACMIGLHPFDKDINDGVLVLYLVLMRGMGFFMITILLPLYKTYFLMANLPDIPAQDVVSSLRAILEDREAVVYFRQFLCESDNHYLLDFWMEIDLFKDAALNNEIDDLYFAAHKIFRKYFELSNHSKAALSIRHVVNSKEKVRSDSRPNKKTFCRAINKMFDDKFRDRAEVHSNVFDHPHRVVFDNMENMHYRLFLRSQHCKELLASVAGQEAVIARLINQQML